MRQAGKIDELALTNFDLAHMKQLIDAGLPVRSLQLQYSLLDRRPAGALSDYCQQHQIGLLAYGALAGGLFGPAWLGVEQPDADQVNRSLVKYLLIVEECGGWEAFQNRLATIQSIAEAHEASIGSVATRWVLEQPAVEAVIVGARNDRWLEENLKTLALRLSRDELKQLDEGAFVQGEIYDLERERDGRHASIMRYDLNRQP